ncbi:MAG TPA: hypothetical protein VI758_11015 [Bacteroidota bacterium]
MNLIRRSTSTSFPTFTFGFLLLLFPLSTYSQSLFLLRGTERFPVRELADGGKSVVVDGKTYFLVAKEDLAALSAESEVLRTLVTRNDTLFAKHDALLARYARYEDAAENLIARQDSQIVQSEKINKAFDDLYRELKRIAGISPWSISGGLGVYSFDADARLMASLGIGYQHWMAHYQFGKNYNGVVVGFRLSL